MALTTDQFSYHSKILSAKYGTLWQSSANVYANCCITVFVNVLVEFNIAACTELCNMQLFFFNFATCKSDSLSGLKVHAYRHMASPPLLTNFKT